MSGPPKASAASHSLALSAARLASVQALYQMDLAATDLNAVIEEFCNYRLTEEGSEATCARADQEHFTRVLKGVVARQRDIDPLVDQQLAAGWRLVRIDSILRAVLRAAVFELMELSDIPARVIISEYIDVAHAFFAGEEPKVVNGVLDRIARKLRPGELPQRT
jgi:N utilization substance protein B